MRFHGLTPLALLLIAALLGGCSGQLPQETSPVSRQASSEAPAEAVPSGTEEPSGSSKASAASEDLAAPAEVSRAAQASSVPAPESGEGKDGAAAAEPAEAAVRAFIAQLDPAIHGSVFYNANRELCLNVIDEPSVLQAIEELQPDFALKLVPARCSMREIAGARQLLEGWRSDFHIASFYYRAAQNALVVLIWQDWLTPETEAAVRGASTVENLLFEGYEQALISDRDPDVELDFNTAIPLAEASGQSLLDRLDPETYGGVYYDASAPGYCISVVDEEAVRALFQRAAPEELAELGSYRLVPARYSRAQLLAAQEALSPRFSEFHITGTWQAIEENAVGVAVLPEYLTDENKQAIRAAAGIDGLSFSEGTDAPNPPV